MGASGLGSLLVKEGFLTEQDRLTITKTCGQGSWAFAKSIVAMGLLDEDELAAFFAERTRFQIAPKDFLRHLDHDAVQSFDRRLVSKLEVIPLKKDSGKITVGVVDPLDKSTLKQLEFFTGLQVNPVVVPLSQLYEGLAKIDPEYKRQPTALTHFLQNHAQSAWVRQKLDAEAKNRPLKTKTHAPLEIPDDTLFEEVTEIEELHDDPIEMEELPSDEATETFGLDIDETAPDISSLDDDPFDGSGGLEASGDPLKAEREEIELEEESGLDDNLLDRLSEGDADADEISQKPIKKMAADLDIAAADQQFQKHRNNPKKPEETSPAPLAELSDLDLSLDDDVTPSGAESALSDDDSLEFDLDSLTVDSSQTQQKLSDVTNTEINFDDLPLDEPSDNHSESDLAGTDDDIFSPELSTNEVATSSETTLAAETEEQETFSPSTTEAINEDPDFDSMSDLEQAEPPLIADNESKVAATTDDFHVAEDDDLLAALDSPSAKAQDEFTLSQDIESEQTIENEYDMPEVSTFGFEETKPRGLMPAKAKDLVPKERDDILDALDDQEPSLDLSALELEMQDSNNLSKVLAVDEGEVPLSETPIPIFESQPRAQQKPEKSFEDEEETNINLRPAPKRLDDDDIDLYGKSKISVRDSGLNPTTDLNEIILKLSLSFQASSAHHILEEALPKLGRAGCLLHIKDQRQYLWSDGQLISGQLGPAAIHPMLHGLEEKIWKTSELKAGESWTGKSLKVRIYRQGNWLWAHSLSQSSDSAIFRETVEGLVSQAIAKLG